MIQVPSTAKKKRLISIAKAIQMYKKSTFVYKTKCHIFKVAKTHPYLTAQD
jgi:hypothetical protein